MLLAAIFGFLPGDDERLRATVQAIAEELTENGFVLRYRTDETDDGLSGKEGTFLICSFWLVSALAIVGELQQARDLMERLLRIASPLGLYAEEFDADTGRHLGNFPQAFSHLALIEAAARIIVPELMTARSEPGRSEETMDAYDVIIIGTGAGGGTLARHLAPSGQADPAARAGRLAPARAAELVDQDVFVDNRYVSPDTWYDEKGKAFQPRRPLLRRRGDEALRRRALPAAQGGLRRAPPPRRHLARLADVLRRVRAVLHARGAALRGARRARRGPDRTAGERALPASRRVARATDPAARRPARGRRLPPVPRAVRDHARRVQPTVQHVHSLCHVRRLPLPRPREVGRRGARRASGPRARQRHAADEPEGGQARHRRRRAPPSPRSWSTTTGRRSATRPTSSSSSGGAANSAKILLLSANDKHPNGLANGSDQVGRNYMFHDSTAVLALSREENKTAYQKTLGLNDFYFGADDFEYPLGNVQMVGKSTAPMFRGERPGETKLAPEWTLERMAKHAIDFWLSTEDLPRPDNRVTRRSRREHRAHLQGDERRGRRSGSTRNSSRSSASSDMNPDHLIHRFAYMKNDIPVAGCAHQAGTCRFGTDPAASVLDADCKAHELDNLYVVDTSFFPSIGAVNPALTAMANALRVGDHLLERLA